MRPALGSFWPRTRTVPDSLVTMTSETHGERRRPSLWFLILCSLPIGLAVWAWSFDPFGDRGMTNIITMLAVILVSLLALGWYLLRSGAPRRARLRVLAGVVAALLITAALVRIDGFSGVMLPELAFRSSPDKRAAPLRDTIETSATAIDLRKTSPTDYPGFLGAARDQTVRGVRLARSWDEKGPQQLWKHPVGEAWSAFAIVAGVAITQEQRGAREAVTAYGLEDGKLLWKHEEEASKTHPVGGAGPRCTPLIDEGRVFALGATGILVCLDGKDGSVIWRKDLPKDFGITPEDEASTVDYGRSTSPLVLRNMLIVPIGGPESKTRTGLVAFEKATGKLLWKGPSRHISCASPAVASVAGREQLLIVHEASVAGHDPADGSLLWEYPWPGKTSADPVVSQVVKIADDAVFISKGYGLGSARLRLVPARDETKTPLAAELVWATRRSLRTKFTNIVHMDGHAYGLSDCIFECVDLANGKRAWKGGRYGHGQILRVEELLLVLTEEGELLLMEPRPDEKNKILARAQVLDGKTWNNLALSGDLLAVRNANEAAVYRLPLAAKK